MTKSAHSQQANSRTLWGEDYDSCWDPENKCLRYPMHYDRYRRMTVKTDESKVVPHGKELMSMTYESIVEANQLPEEAHFAVLDSQSWQWLRERCSKGAIAVDNEYLFLKDMKGYFFKGLTFPNLKVLIVEQADSIWSDSWLRVFLHEQARALYCPQLKLLYVGPRIHNLQSILKVKGDLYLCLSDAHHIPAQIMGIPAVRIVNQFPQISIHGPVKVRPLVSHQDEGNVYAHYP